MKKIVFKNIKLIKINKYHFSSNELIEASIVHENEIKPAIIKISRNFKSTLEHEIKILKKLTELNYNYIPKIYETGYLKEKTYIVMEKVSGDNINYLIRKNNYYKYDYLKEYGKFLAAIHKINTEDFQVSKKRIINIESNDSKIKPYIDYLKDINIIENKVFVHGDYHYGNVLWNGKRINKIIDFEYSGIGLKEEDIAFALTYKPKMNFLDNIEDINAFLDGYKLINEYDKNTLKHFYMKFLINEYILNKDIKYQNTILKLLNIAKEM